jgi:hypothetical protein
MTRKTTANVCILESLGFMDEDAYREGEIISRTLKMSGKRPYYVYVRSRDELKAFIKEFGESHYRYLHISCHGSANGAFWTTLGSIPGPQFAKILAPHVNHRRVFVSACLATNSAFATKLIKESDCSSVVGPVGTVSFDDAAIFWTSFYHLMFKENRVSMKNRVIEEKLEVCARLINEKFRFFFKRDQEIIERTIG